MFHIHTVLFLLYSCTSFTIVTCDEKITYIRTEHPFVGETNKKHLLYAKLTSERYGRRNPVYYVGLHFRNARAFDNSYMMSFYFLEFLNNQYQRSFVEMHFRWCNLIEKDKIFGAAMKQGKLALPCPHKPDEYNLYNMTVLPEAIPRGFPFTKGRIVLNVTYVPSKDHVVTGHIDMEIKQFKVKNRQKNVKL